MGTYLGRLMEEGLKTGSANVVVCRIVDTILRASHELWRLSRGARLNSVGYLML